MLESVNQAGGFGPEADHSRVLLTRKGTTFRVDIQAMYENGAAEQNALLEHGDILNVQDRSFNKDEGHSGVAGMRRGQNANVPDFDQAQNRGRTARNQMAVFGPQLYLIVGYQATTTINQAQSQIGFAAT